MPVNSLPFDLSGERTRPRGNVTHPLLYHQPLSVRNRQKQRGAAAEKQPLKREKEAKKQKTSKKIKFHPLHCGGNCAILQKLEYARSHGRLHGRPNVCDHGSGEAPSSLTKRSFSLCGVLGFALLPLRGHGQLQETLGSREHILLEV